MSCRCHASDLYAGLIDCSVCGHRSLDVGRSWAGCERRGCGWQTEDRRSYRTLARWPAWGLFVLCECQARDVRPSHGCLACEGVFEQLVATIRAESGHAARALFRGNGLVGDRVRRLA